jgi:hypothetical protein
MQVQVRVRVQMHHLVVRRLCLGRRCGSEWSATGLMEPRAVAVRIGSPHLLRPQQSHPDRHTFMACEFGKRVASSRTFSQPPSCG